MTVHARSTTVAVLGGALLTLGLAACEDARTPPGPAERGLTEVSVRADAGSGSAALLNQDLAALRRATAGFHRFESAREAGHAVLVRHPDTDAACLEHPTDGGMGRHYLDPSLVDDAVSVTEPEVVIYEPTENGELRLVGVEYVIPYAIRGPEETPPTLFGREFLHNPTFRLWMLHVYVWKQNPSGTFATWNPRITCAHDGAVD